MVECMDSVLGLQRSIFAWSLKENSWFVVVFPSSDGMGDANKVSKGSHCC